MLKREQQTCPIRSDYRRDANERSAKKLFERDWDVFVIKRDPEKGAYNWFTLCCEAAGLVTNGRAHCSS